MPGLEVFADIACPFTHVGLHRIFAERADRHRAVEIRVRAWPLEWVNGRPLDPQHIAEEVDVLREQVAPTLFAGFDPARFPQSSIPALGLAAAAYELGPAAGEAASLALRRALFEEGRDPSDPDVLGAIAVEVGLDATTVPTLEQAEAAVRADWDEGRARGVQGSPHFFLDGGNWFCPVLHIERDTAGALHVHEDVDAEQQFFATLFA